MINKCSVFSDSVTMPDINSIIPINSIIHSLLGMDTVNASLPISSAIILIILSMILTIIGGFIPSKKAAKKDPVTALRTE